VYLRLPESIASWEAIPESLLVDCAQLVKANSIEGESPNRLPLPSPISNPLFSGNKRNDLTIIYTPADNLKVCFLQTVLSHTPNLSNVRHVKENWRYGRWAGILP